MQIVAHRGASLVAPENTMSAFVAAKRLGADGIEFDVHMTLDQELVVIHDATLQRTTDGIGEVCETQWRSIASLDAGSWFSAAFATERVPLLSDVLALPDVRFEIELKGFGGGFLERVVDQTSASERNLDRIEFTSGNLLLLSRLKQLVPSAQVGLFTKRPDPAVSETAFERYILRTAQTSGFDVAHVWAGAITPRIVQGIHELSMIVHANNADMPKLIRRAITAGADRCTTVDVAMAVAELAGFGR
jgi:glycerophosphoryl diester phosphodiesterase